MFVCKLRVFVSRKEESEHISTVGSNLLNVEEFV